MKKKLKKQFWGWGVHVDADGNLHDVFPVAHSERDTAPKQKKASGRTWRVRPRFGKKLALSKP